jgi:hypothetical protein
VSVATPVTFTVNQDTPTVTATAPNPEYLSYYVQYQANASLTVNVSSTLGTPSGTVSFMNGTSLADSTQGPVSLDASGNAKFNLGNLAKGTYSLTAVYSGDQNFAGVSYTIATFQVVAPGVLITSSPTTLSLTPGVVGSVTLTVQSIAGYGGDLTSISIGCATASLPSWSECTFDQTSFTVPVNGSTTVVMSISTNVPVNGGASSSALSKQSPFALAGMFGLGLLGLAFGRKTRFYGRTLTILCLMLLSSAAILGVTACSNSGYTHTPPEIVVTTPAGTTNVSVVATSGGSQVSLPFALSVTVQ